jgi:DNA-binding transcriptional regulator YdaS (Cro superfamily)
MTSRIHFSQAVADAIDRAGGVSAVAKAIGIEYQSVREWYIGDRRVPMRRCPALAHLAGGVSVEELRPDLKDAWKLLREAA